MADVKSLRCVDELKTKLLQAKENLRNLDENIKKSWGGRGHGDQFPEGINRGHFQRRPSTAAAGGFDQSVNNRLIGLAAGGTSNYGATPAAMRRASGGGGQGERPRMARGAGNAFSRLGLPVGGGGGRGRQGDPAPDSGDEADEVPSRKLAVQSSVVATPRDEKSRQVSAAFFLQVTCFLQVIMIYFCFLASIQ